MSEHDRARLGHIVTYDRELAAIHDALSVLRPDLKVKMMEENVENAFPYIEIPIDDFHDIRILRPSQFRMELVESTVDGDETLVKAKLVEQGQIIFTLDAMEKRADRLYRVDDADADD